MALTGEGHGASWVSLESEFDEDLESGVLRMFFIRNDSRLRDLPWKRSRLVAKAPRLSRQPPRDLTGTLRLQRVIAPAHGMNSTGEYECNYVLRLLNTSSSTFSAHTWCHSQGAEVGNPVGNFKVSDLLCTGSRELS